MPKETPLYREHLKHGGNMTDFGGWALPIQYSSIISECRSVRNEAGLFDVSHMGEIKIEGKDAGRFIEKLITNSIENVQEGRVVYSPVCYPDGGVVDDILVYKYSNENYLLIVNAANTRKDYEWFVNSNDMEAEITDVSGHYAQLALQGPKAQDILQKLTKEPLDKIRFFRFKPDVDIAGINVIVSRTGYTGEDGFEIYTKPESAGLLWNALLEAGKDEGLVPAGLGARDILRFESALPLYGHEISKDITPVEAGLSRFVNINKNSFTGKDILKKQIQEGTKRRLVGLKMIDRGVPRERYRVFAHDTEAGFVTTGAYSPTLGKNIGLAMVDTAYCEEGTKIDVIIRERALKAVVVKTPFYDKKYFKE
jgi:aminomethyltransferase